MVFRAFLCCLLTFGLLQLSWAGSQEGRAAYDGKDYARALKEFQSLLPDPEAEYYLAAMALLGRGQEQDYAGGFDLMKRSADSGFVKAQSALGDIYREGDIVSKNYTRCAEWYQKSAASGDAYSLRRLAYMYSEGWGVSKDVAKGKALFKSAAEGGDPIA